MITRNRRERFYQAETELRQLVEEDNRSIKRCYSLYGPYDLVIPIEAETLSDVHQAVGKICRCGLRMSLDPMEEDVGAG